MKTTRRRWTVREAVYATEHAPRKSPKQLALDLGRTKSSVRSFAWRNRLITRDARRNLLTSYARLLERGVWASPRVIDDGRVVDLDADFESFMSWSVKNGYKPGGDPAFNTEKNAWQWTP